MICLNGPRCMKAKRGGARGDYRRKCTAALKLCSPGPAGSSHCLRHLRNAWGAQFQAGHQADCSEFQVTQCLLCRIPYLGNQVFLAAFLLLVAYLLKVTGGACSVARQRGTAGPVKSHLSHWEDWLKCNKEMVTQLIYQYNYLHSIRGPYLT